MFSHKHSNYQQTFTDDTLGPWDRSRAIQHQSGMPENLAVTMQWMKRWESGGEEESNQPWWRSWRYSKIDPWEQGIFFSFLFFSLYIKEMPSEVEQTFETIREEAEEQHHGPGQDLSLNEFIWGRRGCKILQLNEESLQRQPSTIAGFV